MPVVGVGGGKFYYMNYGDASVTQVPLPAGVVPLPAAMRPLPVFSTWEKDCFISGYFSRTLRFTNNYELVEGGIHRPPKTPTLAAGASSGGSSGESFGQITFAQERLGPNGTAITIHESNPTEPTAIVSLTGQGRVWGNLPTTSVDPRVTHVYGYVSMDASIPRRAWKRELAAGVTSVTENVLTAWLGEELPTLSSADGEEDVDTEARGVAPYCKIAIPFHDSMYYMGFPDKPHVIVPSKLFEPESINLADDSDTALVTPGREAVIGACVHEATEKMLVFCAPATGAVPRIYAITGYVGQDVEIAPVNSFYRLLSQQGIISVGADGDLWFPTQKGPALFNGSFRLMLENRDCEWARIVKDNPEAMARCWAVYSQEERATGYKLRLPLPDPLDEANATYYFFGHDEPVSRGDQPWWTDDVRTRDDTCAAAIIPFGKTSAEVWTGSADGYIRKEDVRTNADDDTDTLRKEMELIHAHQWLPSQAGDEQHASRVSNVDVYMKNETNAATVNLYPGDDSAVEGVPGKVIEVPVGALPSASRQRVALTSRRFGAGGIASGKGVAVGAVITAPLDVEWRGFSLSYEEGSEQARPYTEE